MGAHALFDERLLHRLSGAVAAWVGIGLGGARQAPQVAAAHGFGHLDGGARRRVHRVGIERGRRGRGRGPGRRRGRDGRAGWGHCHARSGGWRRRRCRAVRRTRRRRPGRARADSEQRDEQERSTHACVTITDGQGPGPRPCARRIQGECAQITAPLAERPPTHPVSRSLSLRIDRSACQPQASERGGTRGGPALHADRARAARRSRPRRCHESSARRSC